MAWLTNWNYRKSVTISNTGSILSDYQVLVTIDSLSLATAGKMRSDCADMRFTTSDGSSLIYYWIESGCSTSSTKVWVKIPSIPSGTTTIYLYYGNATPPSDGYGSNLTGTFGTSTATSAIPGCTLGQACIISSNRTISASGTYGHPYIRIDPGVTLTIDGPGVIAYFDSIGRFDIKGTISCAAGGYNADGGVYWGTGSGGNGGIGGGFVSCDHAGKYGGGGTIGIAVTCPWNCSQAECGCYGSGFSYGGGGANTRGCFLSIKSDIINIPSGSLITGSGVSGGTGRDMGGAGAGILVEMQASKLMAFNGSMTFTAGSGGNAPACTSGGGGGGGILNYINYSSFVGTGNIILTAGNGGTSNGVSASNGGTATLTTPSGTQTGNSSGTTGGTINKTFTVGGSEPTFNTIGTEELPALITAIDPMIITTSQTPCLYGTCTVTVTVTWQNQGGTTGSFVPSLTIDGTLFAPYPSEDLGPGASVIHAFDITNLAAGVRTICPNPN